MITDEQQKKITAIREKAKRHHSEEHKRKIGAGVSKSKETKTEIESRSKSHEVYPTLEEALEGAVELFQFCKYPDHKAPAEETFNVVARYQRSEDEEHRYWAGEYKIVGIQNTIAAGKKLLASEPVDHITIKIVRYNLEVGKDGIKREKISEDFSYVMVVKLGDPVIEYMVLYRVVKQEKEEK